MWQKTFPIRHFPPSVQLRSFRSGHARPVPPCALLRPVPCHSSGPNTSPRCKPSGRGGTRRGRCKVVPHRAFRHPSGKAAGRCNYVHIYNGRLLSSLLWKGCNGRHVFSCNPRSSIWPFPRHPSAWSKPRPLRHTTPRWRTAREHQFAHRLPCRGSCCPASPRPPPRNVKHGKKPPSCRRMKPHRRPSRPPQSNPRRDRPTGMYPQLAGKPVAPANSNDPFSSTPRISAHRQPHLSDTPPSAPLLWESHREAGTNSTTCLPRCDVPRHTRSGHRDKPPQGSGGKQRELPTAVFGSAIPWHVDMPYISHILPQPKPPSCPE